MAQGADKEESFGERQATALTAAAEKGHLPVVRFLVEQGADMEKTDRNGNSPLMYATMVGHVEMVRYLLEQGANRDKANSEGYTSLHVAASCSHLEIAKLLKVYGADLNARTTDGDLPIDVAYTNEIEQAIRDEPRRRLDHGHKRATEQDRHQNEAATSASAQQEGVDEGGKEEVEGTVADEDQGSEPSGDDEDGH